MDSIGIGKSIGHLSTVLTIETIFQTLSFKTGAVAGLVRLTADNGGVIFTTW